MRRYPQLARLLPVSALAITALHLVALDPYETEITAWRKQYEDRLRAPDGWLSVAGLSWLHPGENSVGSDANNDIVLPTGQPAHLGTVHLEGKTAVLHADGKDQTLVADKDPVTLAGLSLALIERNQRFAIRLRDPNAATRRDFTGTKWFPIRPEYRMDATWVPYSPPHTISIASILGYSEPQQTPGYATFTLAGNTLKLEPIVEEPGELFFIFKDQTSKHDTYGAGRFLKAHDPVNGKVLLDFNQAYNPPCAYTAFATCPLPPKQNVLPVRIEAGELRYGSH